MSEQAKVRLVSRQGHAALIEWTDDTGTVHRAIAPLNVQTDGAIDQAELDYAIPADGVDLTAAITAPLTIDPARLQNELRRAGVWTKEDYLSMPKVILGVLQRLYGVDVATLQNIALQELNND